jgi:hypothetical protein
MARVIGVADALGEVQVPVLIPRRTPVMPNLTREREMRDYRDTASVKS